jgi:hypothetical protein
VAGVHGAGTPFRLPSCVVRSIRRGWPREPCRLRVDGAPESGDCILLDAVPSGGVRTGRAVRGVGYAPLVAHHCDAAAIARGPVVTGPSARRVRRRQLRLPSRASQRWSRAWGPAC